MKYLKLYIFFFSVCLTASSQDVNRFHFLAGYGFYEGYTVGGEYILGEGKQSLYFSGGYDKSNKKHQEYASLSLGFNLAVFRKNLFTDNSFKWHINNKVIYWQLYDEYYKWKVLTLIPSVNRNFPVYRRLKISFDAGPAFNIVLYNKRLTFREVGWPYHVTPCFRILFII